MTQTSYRPTPGSIPYRVLAHLESLPRGAEVPTAQLAQAARAEAYKFAALMDAARQAGVIFARQKGGHPKSPLFWSLVDHSKEHTPQGANRDASAGQSHVAGESASSAGRGADGPSARGAAPVLQHDPKGLAGASCRPDTAKETARTGAGSADIAATREMATGAGDDAKHEGGPASPGGTDLVPELVEQLSKSMRRAIDAVVPGARAIAKRAAAKAEQTDGAPAEKESLRIALWSDGELQIRRPGGHAVVFTREETRQIVAYLEAICLDSVREAA